MDIEKEILDAEKELDKGLDEVNKYIHDNTIDFMVSFLEEGNKLKLNTKKLAALKTKLEKLISSSKYDWVVTRYLKKYDLIDKLNTEWYAKNKYRIDKVIGSEILKEYRNQAVENLLSKGAIDEHLVKPILQQVRKDIILGTSYENAKNNLKILFEENKVVSNYAGQVAKDSINQYDGELNNQVRIKFKLTHFRYIGSEIETSRPFCRHMKDQGEWSVDELQSVLDEFCPNGVPSDVRTTIQTTDSKGKKVTKSVAKGGGMIEGTNVDNFASLRGGYNCRHRVLFFKK